MNCNTQYILITKITKSNFYNTSLGFIKMNNEIKVSNKPRLKAMGTRIKQRREAFELTQKGLAKKCGWSQSTINLYESGKRMPSLEAINILAMHLQTSVSFLVEGIAPLYDFPRPAKMFGVRELPVLNAREALTWDHTKMEQYMQDKKREKIYVHDAVSRYAYGFRAEGDAMQSPVTSTPITIFHDDKLVLEPPLTPVPGDIVAAAEEGAESVILRQYVVEGAKRYLKPLNPQYPMIEITEKVKILAVVLQKVVNMRPIMT
jgi:SOS-response transcriptional repressor LexA